MEQWTEGPENWVLLLPQLCNLGHVTVLPWASVSLAVEQKLECIVYVIFMWSLLIQSPMVWGPLFLKSVLLWPSLCLSPDPRFLIRMSDFVLLGFLCVRPLQDQDDTLPASLSSPEGNPFTCGRYWQEQSPQHGVGAAHLLSCFMKWLLTASSCCSSISSDSRM